MAVVGQGVLVLVDVDMVVLSISGSGEKRAVAVAVAGLGALVDMDVDTYNTAAAGWNSAIVSHCRMYPAQPFPFPTPGALSLGRMS